MKGKFTSGRPGMKGGSPTGVAAVAALSLLLGGCLTRPLPDLEDDRIGTRELAAPAGEERQEARAIDLGELQALLASSSWNVSLAEPIDRGRHRLLPLTLRTDDAMAGWTDLRDLVQTSGWWPVVVGGPEALSDVRTAMREYEMDPVDDILDRAAGLSIAAWARERRRELRGALKDYRAGWFSWRSPAKVNRDLSVHADYTAAGTVIPGEIAVILIPTARSWEAPAYLEFGGFNECPYPEVLVAFLHRWNRAVGAELASIGWSTIELVLPEPVADSPLALDLARERFYVCPDSIYQGFADLDDMAAAIERDLVWFFWWD